MMRLALLVSCVCLGIDSAAVCPNPFIRLGTQCYYFSSQAASWYAAREACQAMGINGQSADLAVFDVVPEDYVPVFNHAIQLVHVGDLWWIGGTQFGHRGYWQWLDGRAVDLVKTYWRHDEPDNVDTQNVMEMRYEPEESYPRMRFGDYVETTSYHYICQLGVKAVF